MTDLPTDSADTLARVRVMMATQIGKTGQAAKRLRRGAKRFPLFAIAPGLGVLILALMGGDDALVILFAAATAVPLIGGVFYYWSYRMLRGEIHRMVRHIDALNDEDKAALLHDFLGD